MVISRDTFEKLVISQTPKKIIDHVNVRNMVLSSCSTSYPHLTWEYRQNYFLRPRTYIAASHFSSCYGVLRIFWPSVPATLLRKSEFHKGEQLYISCRCSELGDINVLQHHRLGAASKKHKVVRPAKCPLFHRTTGALTPQFKHQTRLQELSY